MTPGASSATTNRDLRPARGAVCFLRRQRSMNFSLAYLRSALLLLLVASVLLLMRT